MLGTGCGTSLFWFVNCSWSLLFGDPLLLFVTSMPFGMLFANQIFDPVCFNLDSSLCIPAQLANQPRSIFNGQMMSEKCRFTCHLWALSPYVVTISFRVQTYDCSDHYSLISHCTRYLSIYLGEGFGTHHVPSKRLSSLIQYIYCVSYRKQSFTRFNIFWQVKLFALRFRAALFSVVRSKARRVKFILDFIYRFNISCTLWVTRCA